MSPALTENATLDWLGELDWLALFVPDIAPGEPHLAEIEQAEQGGPDASS